MSHQNAAQTIESDHECWESLPKDTLLNLLVDADPLPDPKKDELQRRTRVWRSRMFASIKLPAMKCDCGCGLIYDEFANNDAPHSKNAEKVRQRRKKKINYYCHGCGDNTGRYVLKPNATTFTQHSSEWIWQPSPRVARLRAAAKRDIIANVEPLRVEIARRLLNETSSCHHKCAERRGLLGPRISSAAAVNRIEAVRNYREKRSYNYPMNAEALSATIAEFAEKIKNLLTIVEEERCRKAELAAKSKDASTDTTNNKEASSKTVATSGLNTEDKGVEDPYDIISASMKELGLLRKATLPYSPGEV